MTSDAIEPSEPPEESAQAGVTIAAIQKSKTAQLRVTLDTYKGCELINLRIWSQFSGDPEYKPTKRGIAIDIRRLPELRQALQDAEAALLHPSTVQLPQVVAGTPP